LGLFRFSSGGLPDVKKMIQKNKLIIARNILMARLSGDFDTALAIFFWRGRLARAPSRFPGRMDARRDGNVTPPPAKSDRIGSNHPSWPQNRIFRASFRACSGDQSLRSRGRLEHKSTTEINKQNNKLSETRSHRLLSLTNFCSRCRLSRGLAVPFCCWTLPFDIRELLH